MYCYGRSCAKYAYLIKIQSHTDCTVKHFYEFGHTTANIELGRC